MKYVPIVASVLLGALFIMGGVMFFLHAGTPPPFPPDSPAALFMGAVMPTGYMAFVKVFELLGGILVMIPKTRNFGLLALGPIILNILAFNAFILKGEGLVSPITAFLVIVPLYLLWVGRKNFAGLAN